MRHDDKWYPYDAIVQAGKPAHAVVTSLTFALSQRTRTRNIVGPIDGSRNLSSSRTMTFLFTRPDRVLLLYAVAEI